MVHDVRTGALVLKHNIRSNAPAGNNVDQMVWWAADASFIGVCTCFMEDAFGKEHLYILSFVDY